MSDTCYLGNRIYFAGLSHEYAGKLPILSQGLPTGMLPCTDFRSLDAIPRFPIYLIRAKMLTL